MTVIRPTLQVPPTGFAQRANEKLKVQQAVEQVKDGFQSAKSELMKLNPGAQSIIGDCTPGLPELFEKNGPLGGKIPGVIIPKPPPSVETLEDAFYDHRLRNMSPKELFVEEAKQREILEDASTGPIQDADAAAKAEKRLEAIEAERERRANAPELPQFPRPFPDLKPEGGPVILPGKINMY